MGFEKGFAQEDELDALRKNIPGEPGKDYPIYSISILCKINPKNPGCGGGNGGGKGDKNGGGNGGKGGNNRPNGGNGNGGNGGNTEPNNGNGSGGNTGGNGGD